MKKIILLFLLVVPFTMNAQNEKVNIQGTVKDYSKEPIDSANVLLFNPDFQPIYQTVTNSDGHYSLDVPKGNYYGMAVVNMNHYGKSKLEYWAWNIPAHENLQIDPRYHKMEVYALNAFRPQGAHPSYIIYFRPMSLTKSQNRSTNQKEEQISNIAPELKKSEMNIIINGEKVSILSIQKVKEYNEDKEEKPVYMYSYLVQTTLPSKIRDDYQIFKVILDDNETGDKGEAMYFKQSQQYKKH